MNRERIQDLLRQFDRLTEERNRVAEELSAAFSDLSGSPADDGRLMSIVAASIDRGEGVVPFTFQALRGQRLRDPRFPAPVKSRGRGPGQPHLYRPADLRSWCAAKEAS
jgi:hypothetical protein